jgi:hypothetical protein
VWGVLLQNLSFSDFPIHYFVCTCCFLLTAVVLVQCQDGSILNSRPAFRTFALQLYIFHINGLFLWTIINYHLIKQRVCVNVTELLSRFRSFTLRLVVLIFRGWPSETTISSQASSRSDFSRASCLAQLTRLWSIVGESGTNFLFRRNSLPDSCLW